MWPVRSGRRGAARRRPEAEVLEGRQLLAGDILAPQAVPLTTAPNLPNQAVAVATFATPGPDHPATSYTATIDWGDGTAPTAATIVANNFGYIAPTPFPPPMGLPLAVTGDHTYTHIGHHSIHVTIRDKAGAADTVTTPADVEAEAITVQTFRVIAYPGTPTGNVEVASFDDTSPQPHGAYAALIDWGDGTAATPGTIETVFFGGPIVFGPLNPRTRYHQVVGAHTYAKAGTYTIHVTVASVAAATGDASSPTTVADVSVVPQDLSLTTRVPPEPYETAGQFDVADPKAQPGDFTATVDWGDGTPLAPGKVVEQLHAIPLAAGAPGVATSIVPLPVNFNYQYPRFAVALDHTYTRAGTYTVRIHIVDKAGHSGTITSTATVTDEVLADQGSVPVTTTAGFATPQVALADFSDSAREFPQDHLAATIDWGDGSAPTAGTIGYAPVAVPVQPGVTVTPIFATPVLGERLVVEGAHTYPVAGTYVIHVAITSVSGAHLDLTTTAKVAPSPPPPPAPPTYRVIPLLALGVDRPGVAGDTTVANFLVVTPAPGGGTYLAGIDWGDGSRPSIGSVSVSPLAPMVYLVSVHGVHTYRRAGYYVAHAVFSPIGGPMSTSAGLVVVQNPPVPRATPAAINPAPAPTAPIVPAAARRRHPGGRGHVSTARTTHAQA